MKQALRTLSIPAFSIFYFLLFLIGTGNRLIAQPFGTWTNIPTSGSCTQRHENSMVQAGDKFYLIGGRGGVPVNVFNYSTNTWSQNNSGATYITDVNHFQALTHNGLIYIIGAFTGNYPTETPIPNVIIYDPVSNTWIQGPTIPAGRRRGSAGVVMYNNELYIFNGIINGHTDGWVNWADKYNPATNTWTTLSNSPGSRDHFFAAINGTKVYMAGGRKSSFGVGANGTFAFTTPRIDIYDIPTNTWTSLDSVTQGLPTPRAGAPVGILNNKLFVIGGESLQSLAHDEVQALDLTTNTWDPVNTYNPMPGRRHATQIIESNGVFYLAAGSKTRGGTEIAVNETDFFDKFTLTTFNAPTGTPIAASTLNGSSASVSFGSVSTGITSQQTFTLTNSVGNQGIVISGITLSGNAAFTYTFPYTFPIVLAPGQSVSFPVKVTPTVTGAISGSMTVQTKNGTNSVGTVALSATGVPVNNLAFTSSGSCTGVQIGTSSTVSFSLTSTSNQNITFSQAPYMKSGAVYSITSAPMPTGVTPPAVTNLNVAFSPTATGTFRDTIIIVHNGVNSPTKIPLSCTANDCALPGGFTSGDIGGPSLAGSVCEENNIYTVKASGSDIYNTSDQFYFIYLQVTGDMTVSAKVESFSNSNAFSKAGVMIRETLDANSKHAMMAATPSTNGVDIRYRNTTGGSSALVRKNTVLVPQWVRLIRSGNLLSGYESEDGITWNLVSSTTVIMSSTVYVGLAATSRDNSLLTTAVISNFTIISASLPVEWADIQAEAINNAVKVSWITAREENNNYFVVERSADSRVFESIGTVNSLGNSATPTEYAFTDQLPYKGINYYRIRQVDEDGQFSYSSVVETTFEKAELLVYPNPVSRTEELEVGVSSSSENSVTHFVWHNMLGQTVSQETQALSAGWNVISLSLNDLPPGTYSLSILRTGGLADHKIVIIKD